MKNQILNGVAGTLNVCGKAMVFSYDVCASGAEKVWDVAKKVPNAMGKLGDLASKTPDAMGKVSDVTKKASDATRKVLGLQQRDKPAREATNQKKMKKQAKKAPQESVVKGEETIGEEEGGSAKAKEKPTSVENLKQMVKPQLLSLCKNLNIECDYTDTKDQIIAKILESQ